MSNKKTTSKKTTRTIAKKAFAIFPASWAKITSLVIIGLSFIMVILSVIISIVYKPENIVHAQVESLAKDYYENYIYESIVNSDSSNVTPAEALAPYQEHGLTTVKLRQILVHNEANNADITKYIEEYCNTDYTTIKYRPESPYGRTDYRIDYVYSCNF